MRTNRHSVFIVDDDADDRESIRDAFMASKHHHEYHFIHNGDQLIEKLSGTNKNTNPSVILLDLNMPGKDGRDVLKEIKDNKKLQPIPIIVLTTSSSEKDREASYELGANCFITKPDSYRDLVTITDSIARLWLVSE